MGQNVIIHGKDSTDVLSNDAGKVKTSPVLVTSNALHTWLISQLAGERNPGTANAYAVGNPECEYWVLDEADGTAVAVSAGNPASLYSVYVNETLAGGTITLEDGTGVAVITLPDGLTAGTYIEFPGLLFDTDLTANAAAALTTGNITIGWRNQ